MEKTINPFLKRVTDEIYSKNAKKEVIAELTNHLVKTKLFWINKGMNEKDAEEKAVSQMGDPTLLGKEFNSLYSPKIIQYLKPYFIHLLIGFVAAIIFNIIGSIDSLMRIDSIRTIISIFELFFVILLYLVLSKKYLTAIPKPILNTSIILLLTLNLIIGIGSYLTMVFGTAVSSENGLFLGVILMAFNYGLSPLTSIQSIPDSLSLFLISVAAPLLIYIGSNKFGKVM